MAKDSTLRDVLPVALAVGGLLVISSAVESIFPGDSGPVEPDEIPPDDLTLTVPQLQWMAHEIYVAIFGVGGWDPTEDEQAAADQIAACNTDGDVLKLKEVYGCRSPLIAVGCLTLNETVRRYFSADERAALNARLAAKGITISF